MIDSCRRCRLIGWLSAYFSYTISAGMGLLCFVLFLLMWLFDDDCCLQLLTFAVLDVNLLRATESPS